jgi:DNA-binding protein YbaB
MFNKLKQVKDLRSQAKEMQNMLAGESTTVEHKGITVTMDGNMNITALEISEGMDRESIQAAIPKAVNDALKAIQKVMAKKMQESGGFPGFGG